MVSESGEVPQISKPSKSKELDVDPYVGTSKEHEYQREVFGETPHVQPVPPPRVPPPPLLQTPDSPQFSFMKDLDNDNAINDGFSEVMKPAPPKVRTSVPPKAPTSIPTTTTTTTTTTTREDPEKKKKKHHHHSKKRSFKAGDKDVKFDSYDGDENVAKALAFIRQFEVAFSEGNFKERSKLRHVSMYLKDMASDWWLTLNLEGKKPKDWEAFKKLFYVQFLPTNFEQDVKKEWDRLAQREHKTVRRYVARFLSVLLKVTLQKDR